MRRPPRHILILVENLSVPLDRRVWNECRTLTEAGYQVSVICPRGRRHDRESFERRDGVEIHRYTLPPLLPGLAGYIWEYGCALTATLLLALRVWRRRPFDVIHACNPPDLFFLIAAPFRLLGVSFLFDHHDANPEILIAKRQDRPGRGLPEIVVSAAERLTFLLADVVVSPNDSYREIALTRGRRRPDDVVVVRSAPWRDEFAAPEGGDRFDRRGHRYLVSYLGVMGAQDGVDLLVDAVALLVGRGYDILLYLAGDGESYRDIAAVVASRGLKDRVLMPGYQDRDEFTPVLASSDVCVAPDPSSPFNEISTMNKIVEYMALSRVSVSFGLRENRVSGGDAAVYAADDTVEGLAAAITGALDMSDEERTELGRKARRRFEDELCWEHSQEPLRRAYRQLERRSRGTLRGR